MPGGDGYFALSRIRQGAGGSAPSSHQDEALARDLSWKFTPVIVEWKRGKSTDDLIEISEDEARQIIERFRARWAQG
jgi:hypothetical protein